MMGIKKDMADAATKVLADHWSRNKGLTDRLTQMTKGGLTGRGAFFEGAPVQEDGAYGVLLSYKDAESPISLRLTIDADGAYSFASTGDKDGLTYQAKIETGNGAINRLNEWVTNIGIAFDLDIHGQIAKANYKAPAAAPMDRRSE